MGGAPQRDGHITAPPSPWGCKDSSFLSVFLPSHLQGMCCANFEKPKKENEPKSDSSKQEITFVLPLPPRSGKSFPASLS